ncbi:CpaF family protein [Actinomarinicola tropica]|uniref:CpaF family protein n=1 Tax=Actinomarinicola tropica TaxID=2789776 RepID=A0A5Q2RP41_9ACTN|nr:ATPase, T2SS/T4P/T4SS family [Actinomarinicola tropica]QGG95650.1 CpaF family protein [Actinomarinicola tropica]
MTTTRPEAAPGVGDSPLLEIERRVAERAKDLAIDLDRHDAEASLRRLVNEEITTWADDYERGRRHHPLADPERVAERALRNIAGLGPLGPLLADEDVWEIMVNAPDAVFVKRHRGHSGYHDEVFHDDEHVIRVLTKILDGSAGAHRKLDPTEGLQDAQLDDGARLHIVHGDVSRGGHVMVNIRKFTGVPFSDLRELVERGTLSEQAATFLAACVRSRLSIVFAGAPGAGKTTLLSCCAAEIDPSLRVVIAEEVFEADVPVANVASMQTRPARADRPAVDLRRLVAGFLRMAPDVAIVGEVRDREALPLLLTLSSGVKGFTTIHAGSSRQALTRLRFVAQLSDTGHDLTVASLTALVTEAVDLVVHSARRPGGPVVTSILAVEDLTAAADAGHFTTTELFHRRPEDDRLVWTGHLPVRASRALADTGISVRELLDDGDGR